MDAEDIDQLLEAASKNLGNKPRTESIEILETRKEGIPKLECSIEAKLANSKRNTTATPNQLNSLPLKKLGKSAKTQDNAGKDWFGLTAPEMTPQLKRDLQLLSMRHVLDPKRFYKKHDKLSPHFAIGTIKEDPTEFFSARLTRKERKNTLAEEILSTRGDYFKSKYRDIQKRKTSGGKKSWRKRRETRA